MMESFKHNITSRLQVQDPLYTADLRKMTQFYLHTYLWVTAYSSKGSDGT